MCGTFVGGRLNRHASLARYIATLVGQEMGSRQLRKGSTGRARVGGGSMSGRLAALLLRRAGWDVDVFERVESELAGRGAGIVAHPELIAKLRQPRIHGARPGGGRTR